MLFAVLSQTFLRQKEVREITKQFVEAMAEAVDKTGAAEGEEEELVFLSHPKPPQVVEELEDQRGLFDHLGLSNPLS